MFYRRAYAANRPATLLRASSIPYFHQFRARLCGMGCSLCWLQTQIKRENPNIQSRGLSKRVKTLLVVLIRAERPGGPRDFIASCRSYASVTGILCYGSKEGEEIRNLPPPWRVFGYFLHEQKVTPPAGCAGCRARSANIGWLKTCITSDQSKNRGAHRMALRDGSMWSSTPTGWVPLRGGGAAGWCRCGEVPQCAHCRHRGRFSVLRQKDKNCRN